MKRLRLSIYLNRRDIALPFGISFGNSSVALLILCLWFELWWES